jgi:tetratricopeptide (TPR) repeat protein
MQSESAPGALNGPGINQDANLGSDPAATPASAPKPKPDAALFSSPGKRSAILCLLLVLLTLGVYNGVVHNGFINLDDNLYLVDNPNVQHGLDWTTVKWSFGYQQANWHPLTWLSHALDWEFFGKNPGGHHYVSLLWHAFNAVLLFLLLQRATGFTWRSLMVAALFAVHPVNVESVAWVAERKNVLSMAFFLLAMMAYGWYAERPSVRRYSLVPLLFALGLMSKPQVITLPCVLLLWDYWPLNRMFAPATGEAAPRFAPASFRWLIIEKIPLFALAALDALLTMQAQKAGLAVRTVAEYSFYGRVGNCIVSYARYVGHAFWPLHLSPTYGHPGDNIPVWHVVTAALFLMSATALVLLSRKRYMIVGWLWFLGTLVPMNGLVQVGDQAMADRYAYIPLIGLFWMAAWGISEFAGDWHVPARWVAATGCAGVLAAAVLCYTLVGYWHDSEKLWDYAIGINSQDFMAHCNRGRILISENRVDEGIAEFSMAERLHRYPVREILRFAGYELLHGYTEDAAERCRRTLTMTEDPQLRSIAWTDIGVADLRLNHPANAKDNFSSALQSDPNSSGALIGMGLVAERAGDYSEAENFYTKAVAIERSDLGFFLLATAFEKDGRHADASQAYTQAQSLTPDLTEVIQRAHQLLP